MAQFWTRKNEQGENKKTISPWEEALRGGDKEQRLPHYNVVAAVIMKGDKVLIVQKGNTRFAYTSGKWEFPGGKIEDGEQPEEALRREISEELDMDISVNEWLVAVEHTYPDFAITMNAYICHTTSESLTLREHRSSLWIDTSQLRSIDWCAADRPIAAAIEARNRR